jgi:chromosome segregation ATPase
VVMKAYIWIFLIWTLTLSSSGDADPKANCNTKCYHSVNTTHGHLLELINLFNATTSSAKVPKLVDLEQLRNDVRELDKIKNESKMIDKKLRDLDKRVTEAQNNTSNDQRIVEEIIEKLNNISEYNSAANKILNEANNQRNKAQDAFNLAQNASNKCQQVNDKYKKFQNLLNTVSKEYVGVKKTFDDATTRAKALNKDLGESFQETVKVKNDFEKIKLPANLIEDYLSKSETNMNRIINRLKGNADLLKALLEDSRNSWNEMLKEKGEEVMKTVAEIREDLRQMDDALRKYREAFVPMDKFTPTVNDESRRLLASIKQQLEELMKRFQSMDFTEEEKKLLGDTKNDRKYLEEIRKRRILIKEYSLLLDAVPADEEELDKVEDEIEKFRRTILLIEEANRLRDELERLRRNRDEILKINCTAIGSQESGLLQ